MAVSGRLPERLGGDRPRAPRSGQPGRAGVGPPAAHRGAAAAPGRGGGGRVSAGFFVLRTPLLPFDEMEEWGRGLTAAAAARTPGEDSLAEALAADRARLRAGLTALLQRPEVREAVFVASPDLWDSL